MKLSPPPDPNSEFKSPPWQTWFNQIFLLTPYIGKYKVADLPPLSVESATGYATNGRKVGEGAGAGTGVPVYFSNGAWRVYSTDAAVAA